MVLNWRYDLGDKVPGQNMPYNEISNDNKDICCGPPLTDPILLSNLLLQNYDC